MSNLIDFVKNGKTIIGACLNYKSLAAERNIPKAVYPLFFLKPTTAYITEGQEIEIPEGFTVNEEIELGVIIGKTCKNVSEKDAFQYVGGYCAALDMTAVSEIDRVKKNGEPWTLVKAFDTACPVSAFIPMEKISNPHDACIWLKVNGKMCQESSTNDLIFNIPQLISYISKYLTLSPNTMILTGSPKGMIAVKPGDKIEAGIKDVVTMCFNVKKAEVNCECK